MSAFGKSRHSLFTANFSINCPDSQAVTSPSAGDSVAMFTQAYIEALPVDAELADLVWEAWVGVEIDDQPATLSWLVIASRNE